MAMLVAVVVMSPRGFAEQEAPVAQQNVVSAEQTEFFESQVRPLLAAHCYECHSGRADKLEGGLRLDGRSFGIKGGDSGPGIVPGKPDESLLIDAVRWQTLEMPPRGKLTKKQVATLVRWVELGAPWPREAARPETASPQVRDWKAIRAGHWAFRPIIAPAPPAVSASEWPSGELDRFVLARLERAGLRPARFARPRVLIRRMYLDLIGLPPSPEEVEAFVEACRGETAISDQDSLAAPLPRAIVMDAIDRLLASPRYGQRWGRYWLDVARYSDGFGGFLDNAALPQAWRYRDWVVEAFNNDLPFDQFIKLQVAGDLIAGRDQAVATGFFAIGPTYHSDGGDPDSVAQAKGETLDDRVDTLSRGLLAMTVSCARCHDHKFDPIPQQDYYSLAGIFNNCRVEETPLADPRVVRSFNAHQQAIRDLEKQLRDKQNVIKQRKTPASDDEQTQMEAWQRDLTQQKAALPPRYDTVHALADAGSRDMHVAIRGDLRKPGNVAPRRFLHVVAGEDAPVFDKGSGRRQLADALADPANPLPARVFVNRVWMHHFGKALVRTPSNFGSLGEKPTHPELLDWLAASFIRSGWSVKALHRTVMSSAAYQMSSRFEPRSFQTDGDNRLLWRMNPRRLDVESWRDAMLAVTGELDPALGGPPIDSIESRRRSLYFKVSRSGDRFATDEFLRLFDFPLMRATVARRPTSIVPQQYLFLMNSKFMMHRAEALVRRLQDEADTDARRIELAYQLLFGRRPSPREVTLALQFLDGGERSDPMPRWRQYAQVLLSSNEFMFVQ